MTTTYIKKIMLTTALLALVAGSAPLTPIVAQAAETTTAVQTKDQTSTTYDIREVILPQTYVWDGTQWSADLNPAYQPLPTTLTQENLASDTYMDGLEYPTGVTKEILRTAFGDMMKETTFPADQTVADYSVEVNGGYGGLENQEVIDRMVIQAGATAWMAKAANGYLNGGTYTRADYAEDYPYMKALIDATAGTEIEMDPRGYELALTDDAAFQDLMTAITYNGGGPGINQAAIRSGIDGDKYDLNKINIAKTQEMTRQVLESPATWLVAQDAATGLTSLNLMAVMPTVFVLDGKGGGTPTNPLTPAEPETPTEPEKPTEPETPTTPTVPTLPVTPTTPTVPTAPGTSDETANLVTGGAGATVAPKGSVVFATKKVGLYSSKNFSAKNRKQWYQKKSRANRPMFVVTNYAKAKNGALRYQVRDVNHHSKTAGKTGYITANAAYTSSVYYAKKYQTVTVINPDGVNAYRQKNLTKKTAHYRQGQVLKVKKIVRHNLTTRMQLTNGRYITANKKLITSGKQTMVKRVQTKRALNRYTTVTLKRANHHYQKGQKLTVLGWDYAYGNDFSRADSLRYRVAGGYITASSAQVKVLK